MQSNLAVPFGYKCSPPQMPELAFYSPDSEDMIFSAGDQLNIICIAGVRSVAMSWTLARNAFVTPFAKGSARAMSGNRYLLSVATAYLHPGFYDLRVVLDTGNGELLEGVSCFGWKVEEMATPSLKPEDFNEFWATAKAEVSATPLDLSQKGEIHRFSREKINTYNAAHAALPNCYDPEGITHDFVESRELSFAAAGGGRVYGWMAKPEGEGPFPAMLILPGAGFGPRPRPLEHARHGYVALDIQVHGQEVSTDHYPVLYGEKIEHDFSAPENYHYYRIHQRVLQAINVLEARDDVDSSRIVVVGGSQGGRLSTVAAGIDSRIAAAIPAITHFGNQPYFEWSETCNANGDDGMGQSAPQIVDNERTRCLAYFDPMNFAGQIKCPVLMNAGLVDPVSRAAHVYGVYNNLNTDDKEMVAQPGLGHDWFSEFDRYAWKWLAHKINSK